MTTEQPGGITWLASLLGLSEAEWRAYRFLHRTGGASAGAVASEVGLPRGRIYELLRGLAERGLVRELPGARIHYVPVPMVEILSTLRLQATSQLQLLEQAIEQLPARPVVESTPVARTRPGDVSVLHGRRAVEAEVRRIVGLARGRFLLGGSRHLAKRLAAQPETLAALKAAHGRGIEVSLFLPDLPEEAEARKRIAQAVGQDVLQLFPIDLLPTVTYAVADTVVLIVVVQPVDDSPLRGADVGIRVEGRAVVDAVRQRFDHLAHGLSSRSLGGLAKAYERALPRARREIVAMGPRAWPRVFESALPRLREPLEAAKKRGVRFRALTEPEPDQATRLPGSTWEARTLPAVPVWITIVDAAELYQAFPTKSVAQPLQVRVSRDPVEVGYWLEWFERWWAEARPLKVVHP